MQPLSRTVRLPSEAGTPFTGHSNTAELRGLQNKSGVHRVPWGAAQLNSPDHVWVLPPHTDSLVDDDISLPRFLGASEELTLVMDWAGQTLLS